ncbi:esterase/lipase family protein [Bacillus thuringiensis]|uniref:esterase/lipase family protein n=1 Tax=Bacillus thuringiensis TaxID=1428 RepID=UPI00119C97B1|nr:lipase [Bacillus thuringiensis]
MLRLFEILFAFCILTIFVIIPSSMYAAETKQNHNPIILVNGFAGWGRDEMLGIKYWGGIHDIQENLKQNGYEVYTAAVGPISSNWDRACELYAQMNGGTVDYGEAHAKKHNHKRYGKTYSGFISNWNETKKVHLVGHSMGGQTIRTLVQLLKEGDPEEQAYAKKRDDSHLSPLFQGEKSYVHSVTTLSTPHNGTTLADGSLLLPFVKDFLIAAASINGYQNLSVYDFKLDQWRLKRKEKESFFQYWNRIQNSPIWYHIRDSSQWDLSTQGAKELNGWVKTQPDVYYFSYSGQATQAGLITGVHYPHITMNKVLMGNAFFLGSYVQFEQNRTVIDASWWQNDGVVNTNSMAGPSIDEILYPPTLPTIGKWNHVETKENWDHLDMIGLSVSDSLGISNIYSFYQQIAEKVASLPN